MGQRTQACLRETQASQLGIASSNLRMAADFRGKRIEVNSLDGQSLLAHSLIGTQGIPAQRVPSAPQCVLGTFAHCANQEQLH